MNVRPRNRASILFFAIGLMLIPYATATGEHTYYQNPDEAVDALIAAAVADDPDAVRSVLGSEVEELRSGDPVADARERHRFAAAAVESAKIEEHSDDRAVLAVGAEDWPFPIPLVREPEGWRFDTRAGAEELLNRRIGNNELTMIEVLRELVAAQHEYRAVDRDGDGVQAYAERLMSSEGKRDGLFWPTSGSEPASPVGALVADAFAAGYRPGESDEPQPYYGYLFRLIDTQGANAPGGEKTFRDEQGRLVEGFAILAYPAKYGASGIMSFTINQSGMLFEKDLGEETAENAKAIASFDPNESWTPVRN